MTRPESLGSSDARLFRFDRHEDERGAFTRTWCAFDFQRSGIAFHPLQASQSTTHVRGTIRGMHFQRAPKCEGKVVRCTRGKIWDVITDLRPDSCTYRLSFSVELDSNDPAVLYVPPGFAHGFQTLTDEVTVEYLMDEVYDPLCADGFRYDDAAAGIVWPLPLSAISQKDLEWPSLMSRTFWRGAARIIPLRGEVRP